MAEEAAPVPSPTLIALPLTALVPAVLLRMTVPSLMLSAPPKELALLPEKVRVPVPFWVRSHLLPLIAPLRVGVARAGHGQQCCRRRG
jgi:hypothetical protein